MSRTGYERNKKYLFMKKHGVSSDEYEETFYPEGSRSRVYNKGNPMTPLERNRKYRYGVDPQIFEDMVNNQNGKCLICGCEKWQDLEVDHNHSTGNVRGLLCQSCNLRLAIFDREYARAFIDYLNNYNS
jgi:hypothetical protein